MEAEAKRNPIVSRKVQEAQAAGKDIPDDVLLRIIDERINQSDCRVNGWVLDGFPQNEAQVNLVSSLNVKPSLVVILDQ